LSQRRKTYPQRRRSPLASREAHRAAEYPGKEESRGPPKGADSTTACGALPALARNAREGVDVGDEEHREAVVEGCGLSEYALLAQGDLVLHLSAGKSLKVGQTMTTRPYV